MGNSWLGSLLRGSSWVHYQIMLDFSYMGLPSAILIHSKKNKHTLARTPQIKHKNTTLPIIQLPKKIYIHTIAMEFLAFLQGNW